MMLEAPPFRFVCSVLQITIKLTTPDDCEILSRPISCIAQIARMPDFNDYVFSSVSADWEIPSDDGSFTVYRVLTLHSLTFSHIEKRMFMNAGSRNTAKKFTAKLIKGGNEYAANQPGNRAQAQPAGNQTQQAAGKRSGNSTQPRPAGNQMQQAAGNRSGNHTQPRPAGNQTQRVVGSGSNTANPAGNQSATGRVRRVVRDIEGRLRNSTTRPKSSSVPGPASIIRGNTTVSGSRSAGERDALPAGALSQDESMRLAKQFEQNMRDEPHITNLLVGTALGAAGRLFC